MSRALRVAALCALALSAAPALAFQRTFIEQNPAACQWWRTRAVTYVLNPELARLDGCGGSAATLLAAARAAFTPWSTAARAAGAAACTDFRFVDGGTTTKRAVRFQEGGANENLVVWRRGVCQSTVSPADPCWDEPDGAEACADLYGCWPHGTGGVIALTTTHYRTDTAEILDADMELFAHDDGLAGYWFTCGSGAPCTGPAPAGGSSKDVRPTGACVSMDLASTLTHEAGHMLGLAHNCEAEFGCDAPRATMFTTTRVGEIHKRDLDADDVDGVCEIYPAGQPPVTCVAVGGASDSGGCGCASAGPADALLLLVLAGLSRLRSRPRPRTPRRS